MGKIKNCLQFYFWAISILTFFGIIGMNTTIQATETSKIHFISTGASDAFLVESNGHFGLIDSANPPYNDGTLQANVENEQYTVVHVVNYLQQVGVQKLDFILATHAHSDHIGGMREIAKYFVDENTTYYYREYVETTDDVEFPEYDNQGYFTRAIEAMESKGAHLVDVTNQTPVFTMGGYTIKLLNTQPASSDEVNNENLARGENKNSICALVQYGNKKVLFTGDMEVEDEARLIEEYGTEIANVDVLKMGHHGSYTSTLLSFAKAVNPRFIVIPNKRIGVSTNVGTLVYLQCLQEEQRLQAVYVTGNNEDAVVLVMDNDISLSNGELISFQVERNENWLNVYYKGELLCTLYEENGQFAYGWKKMIYNGKEEWFCFRRYSGVMEKGWQKLGTSMGNFWFYFDENGPMYKGWNRIDDVWYYFCKEDNEFEGYIEGGMVTGWKKLNTSLGEFWFYFDNNGHMQTGWQRIDNEWYYFCKQDNEIEGYAEGSMVKGWKKLDTTMGQFWFYFDENGHMLTGWQRINSEWYYFCKQNNEVTGYAQGGIVTGWKKLDTTLGKFWFYFDENGHMQKDWINLGGKWFYLCLEDNDVDGYSEGAMIVGRHELLFEGQNIYFRFCEADDIPYGFKVGEALTNVTFEGRTYDERGKEIVDNNASWGDIDGNGSIEILDVRLLLQAYINSTTSTVWTDEQLALMDMNDDAKVDILDVRLLLQAYINS